jgi:hypothetical protein
MAPPPTASAATQTVEARLQNLRGDAQTRTVGLGSGASPCQQKTLVVACRQAGSRRTQRPLLRPNGSPQTCRLTSIFRTSGCGQTARPVVWQGSSGAPLPPMPIRTGAQLQPNWDGCCNLFFAGFGLRVRRPAWPQISLSVIDGAPRLLQPLRFFNRQAQKRDRSSPSRQGPSRTRITPVEHHSSIQ